MGRSKPLGVEVDGNQRTSENIHNLKIIDCTVYNIYKMAAYENTLFLFKWVGMQSFAVVHGFLAHGFLKMFEASFV